MNPVLQNALSEENIAGAYLLLGSKQAVLKETDDFLMSFFCETKRGCGVCKGCKKIAAKDHVDVCYISGSGKTGNIKKADIADIYTKATEKSYEGGYKFFIIPVFEGIEEACQNKLLKIIEEPPAKTVFMILAKGVNDVLTTIASRCIKVKIGEYDEEQAAAEIKNKYNLTTIGAQVISRSAEGDVYFASALAESKYIEIRDDACEIVKKLLWSKTKAISSMVDTIMKYEDKFDYFFFALCNILGDAIYLKHTGQSDKIKNSDKLSDIRAFCAKGTDRALVSMMRIFEQADMKRKVCVGIMKKILIEDTLFRILEVIHV